MHLAVSDGHPVQDPDNSLYHLTFDAETKALRRSDGSWVARPAYPRSGTLVYDGRSLDGRVRVYDLALRGSRPTVAFTTVDRSPDTPGYTYKWATLWGSADADPRPAGGIPGGNLARQQRRDDRLRRHPGG